MRCRWRDARCMELGSELEPELLENLVLLVSELVTNSLRHADTPASAEIELRAMVAVRARARRGHRPRARVRAEAGGQGRGPDPAGASTWSTSSRIAGA